MSSSMRNIFMSLVLGLLVSPSVRAGGFEADWVDLLSEDEDSAARVVRSLSNSSGTLAFLKARLRPVAADSAEIQALLTQLDSDSSRERHEARARLEYLGDLAKPAVAAFLQGSPSLEARKPMEALVEKWREAHPVFERRLNPNVYAIMWESILVYEPKPEVNRFWVRANRAIAVLEQIGTAEAQEMLQQLANGHSDASPTVEARAALARLAARR